MRYIVMKGQPVFLGLSLGQSLYGVLASPPSADSIWAVSQGLDYNDPIYAGWKQIPVISEIQVYNGVENKRTYAHHPELFAAGSNVYLVFSTAPVDEDSMGQEVWISTSIDRGLTWSRVRAYFRQQFYRTRPTTSMIMHTGVVGASCSEHGKPSPLCTSKLMSYSRSDSQAVAGAPDHFKLRVALPAEYRLPANQSAIHVG